MTKHFELIPVDEVRVVRRKRRARGLDRLQASIAEIGLLSPITVAAKKRNEAGVWRIVYRLVAGHARLKACQALGWKAIPAYIRDFDDIDAEIAEIDENLVRNELTVLERGEQFLRRKELYEIKHPETRHGANLRIINSEAFNECCAERKASFVDDTADRTGVAPRTISEDVQIARKIDAGVITMIRDTPLANRKKELVALSRIADVERQAKVAEMVGAGEVENIAEALALAAGGSKGRPRCVVKSFAVPLSPEKAAAALIGKFSREQLATLVQLIADRTGIVATGSDGETPGVVEHLAVVNGGPAIVHEDPIRLYRF